MKKNLRSAFNTRQYMISKDFEIYYYSDLGLKTLSLHSHDYYEFYLFLEGDVSIEINPPLGETIKKALSPGDLILIPPGVEHHSIIQNSDVPYRRFVFWISKEYCERLMEDSVDYVYLFQQATSFKQYYFPLNPADYHLTVSKILRLLEETHSERYGKNATIHLCICDIILTLNRAIYDEKNHLEMGEEVSLFQNLISYIDTNIEQPLSLESLAGEFYVSKFYISHLFKDTLGISPHQYILKKRLSLCRDSIVSGNSISAVFERYGFRDYSSFFKAFKKEYGLSPKEYQSLYSVIKS
ncbi:MAG: helix-turn-helix domain-containing protein [Butyrivibrio sp.]|nr:helix-turn-helix domain-containing protein [Butyrivibrio sp.]